MKKTYYKLQFIECGEDYNVTIVPANQIPDYVQTCGMDNNSKIVITTIEMTEEQYEKWLAKYVKP